MGGTVEKAAKGLVSSTVSTMSAGIVNYDPNTGGLKASLDPKDAAANFAGGYTHGKTAKSLMPEMPEMPKAIDPAEQAKRAEAEAKSKVNKELGKAAAGLSSTILGGSVSGDMSVLRKRKLLGE